MSTKNLDLSLSQFDLNISIPIILAFSMFITYWFLAKSDMIRAFFYSKFDFDKASLYHIFFTKLLGLIVMGFLPVLIVFTYSESLFIKLLNILSFKKDLFFISKWILLLSTIVIPLSYFSGKKPENLKNYPQVRSKNWTIKTLIIYLLGWFFYLFGYELLFRGILLFPLYQNLGFWPAIIVNISLYSTTHIPKGLTETLGAIPLGIILCILTLLSDSIWIAFFVHLALAWTNSLTALKHHPEIDYIKWKRK